MHLMLIDEGSLRATGETDWFVCGGAMFPGDALGSINAEMERIRTTHGYHLGDNLKFSTRDRPDHVTIEQAKGAKKAVLELCRRTGVTFIAYAVPYAWFSRKSSDAQNWYKGVHAVISHFRGYLCLAESTGICLLDRPPQQVPDSGFPLLQSLFLRGGDKELASGFKIKGRFPEIALFGITRNNASHLSSVADILVGGFRWCVNEQRNQTALGACRDTSPAAPSCRVLGARRCTLAPWDASPA